MSLFCNKTFGISVNIINFLLDPTKKVSFDAVLCEKVETPVRVRNKDYELRDIKKDYQNGVI